MERVPVIHHGEWRIRHCPITHGVPTRMVRWSFEQLCQQWRSKDKPTLGIRYVRCDECGGENPPQELTITEEIMATGKKASEKPETTATQEAVASTVLTELARILDVDQDGDVVAAAEALKNKAAVLENQADGQQADLHHLARALNLDNGATREDMDAAIAKLWDTQNNLQNDLARQRAAYDQDTEVLRERLDTYRTTLGELETILGVGLGEDVRAAAQRLKDAADQPRLQGDEAVLADFGRRILRGEVSLCIHTQR